MAAFKAQRQAQTCAKSCGRAGRKTAERGVHGCQMPAAREPYQFFSRSLQAVKRGLNYGRGKQGIVAGAEHAHGATHCGWQVCVEQAGQKLQRVRKARLAAVCDRAPRPSQYSARRKVCVQRQGQPGQPAGQGHCLVPDNDPLLKAYRLKRSLPVWLDATGQLD